MKTLTRKTTKAKTNPAWLKHRDLVFGRNTDFVCLFKMESKFICKNHLDLSEEEWNTMMLECEEWIHFVVDRDSKGTAIVSHRSSSDIQNLGGFVLSADKAIGLTDAEIVAISQEKHIQPNNLLTHLKEDFQGHGISKWSKKSLEDHFGVFAVKNIIEQGYLVQSRKGWVALSHTQPGTVANKLLTLGVNVQRLKELQIYFSAFNHAAHGLT